MAAACTTCIATAGAAPQFCKERLSGSGCPAQRATVKLHVLVPASGFTDVSVTVVLMRTR